MRVIYTKGVELAKPNGRTAYVYERGDFYEVFESGKRVAVISKDFDIIALLSSMGYDYAVFESDDEREVELVTPTEIIMKLKEKNDGSYGAIAIFIGLVKAFSKGKVVDYVAVDVDLSVIKDLAETISKKYGVEVLIHHKLGNLKPKEEIVHVGIMAKSRFELFEALKELIELIKVEHSKGFREEFIEERSS